MNYRGIGPGMFPQQGQGGMAPPMNPMQKQGFQMPQAPAGVQPMPKPGGGGQMPGLGSAQTMVDAYTQPMNDMASLRAELQHAQATGTDPLKILDLQRRLAGLEGAGATRLGQQQQQFNNQMVRAPGIGGASPYDQSWQNANRNNSIEMQILAQMLGLGGGGWMPGRR
jgi:hypothetical protein